jgi:septum formation protein
MGRGPRLLLASASPRRRELLALAGVDFEAVATSVEEAGDGEPQDVVAENALRKARAGLALRPDAEWVLGADTEVAISGRVLGKPASAAEAREYLQELSGRTHEVLGAVAVLHAGSPEPLTAIERTRVSFAALEEGEIQRYLASGEWEDRAGAYAVQGLGASFVTAVDGDLANVIGLPMRALHRLAPELFGPV